MIKAAIFDVFGTVVDWRTGVATVCQSVFTQKSIDFDPYLFADMWRGQYQPAMERIRSGNRGYVALDILHLENLEHVLQETGLSGHFKNNEKAELNTAWEQLPPWPDSVSGLKSFNKRMIIAPCSNGSISLMTRLAKFGGLPWNCILGAEVAQNYKPHPEAYLKSVAALQLQPDEVVMVAAHNNDLESARQNGLKTAFIPRITEYGSDQQSDLEATSDWDFTSKDLLTLSEHIKL